MLSRLKSKNKSKHTLASSVLVWRYMRFGASGFLFLFAVLFAMPQLALACSCDAGYTREQSFEDAQAVFVGHVVDIDHSRDFLSAWNTREHLRVDFAVRELWKGVEENLVTVTTGTGRGDCGFTFEPRGTYLVYAHADTVYGTELIAGRCSRTISIEEAGDVIAALGPSDTTPIERVYEPGSAPVREGFWWWVRTIVSFEALFFVFYIIPAMLVFAVYQSFLGASLLQPWPLAVVATALYLTPPVLLGYALAKRRSAAIAFLRRHAKKTALVLFVLVLILATFPYTNDNDGAYKAVMREHGHDVFARITAVNPWCAGHDGSGVRMGHIPFGLSVSHCGYYWVQFFGFSPIQLRGGEVPSAVPTFQETLGAPETQTEPVAAHPRYEPLAFPDNTLDTSGWETYRNEEFGFSVRHPAGWEVRAYTQPAGLFAFYDKRESGDDSGVYINAQHHGTFFPYEPHAHMNIAVNNLYGYFAPHGIANTEFKEVGAVLKGARTNGNATFNMYAFSDTHRPEVPDYRSVFEQMLLSFTLIE